MNENKVLFGRVSAVGTYVLIAALAWITQGFEIVFCDLALLLSGKFDLIVKEQESFRAMITAILAVIALVLPCSKAIVFLTDTIHGKVEKHLISDTLQETETEGNYFFVFFGCVVLEEYFARWFFLGFLAKIQFFSGGAMFYGLFFMGNAMWSYLHLGNFKENHDRKLLRVLPYFVSGIFLTYLFVKYGLMTTIIAHFAVNAVYFAMHKVQYVDCGHALIFLYGILCALISYTFMEKPVSDILPWFDRTPDFIITGWYLRDYFLLSMFVTGCLVAIFSALCYDHERYEKDESKLCNRLIMRHVLFIPILIGLYYSIYLLMGFITTDENYRIMIVVILWMSIQKCKSGSEMARIFWIGMPIMYITVCILQVLSFWQSMAWIALETMILIPRSLIDEFES